MEARDLPPSEHALPELDDHIVVAESGVEIVRGRLVMTPPAHPPHATTHSRLAYVIGAHVAPPFIVAVELLTRTSRESDFAPDVSVYTHDPETGRRLIAEVAFEVVSAQSFRIPTDKARELTRRGAGRVYAVAVKKSELRIWSQVDDRWLPMSPDAALADRCFVRPVPVRALLDAAHADTAVVAALLARGVPELVDLAVGEARALREGIAHLCAVLDIDLDSARQAHLDGLDAAALRELAEHLRNTRRWP